MNIYHICFLIGAELCTGVNVTANDYSTALQKFNSTHKNKQIIYITEKMKT